MTAFLFLQFIAGLVLLVIGAELLVRGASRLAIASGITPLVVGLTVVAYGTSMPEAAVSVQAALEGSADIALGNVIGSNIFNVLFVLGTAALVAPLAVSKQLVRMDVPVMVFASTLLYALSLNGRISVLEGVVLLVLLVGYTILAIRQGRRGNVDVAVLPDAPPAVVATPRTHAINVVLMLAGLALLLLGANWLVASAVSVATQFGVSPLVIGLTIVAAGTSLPELATSVAATIRGEREIAIGNVVGSNTFNILFVLGSASAFSSTGIGVPASALTFDIPVMLAVAVACLPIFYTGYSISRFEGAVFVFYYIAYTTYLVLHGVEHEAAPVVRWVVMSFVAPITALTISMAAWRQYRTYRRRRRL